MGYPILISHQVFILEGLPILFCAIYTFFFLPNCKFQPVVQILRSIIINMLQPDPETVKFLSKQEKEAILASLPAGAPTMNAKTWDFSQVKSLFKDPTFIPFLMIWITHGIGGWGISFVLPTVIYELGISGTANSQLMTMVSSANIALNLNPAQRRLTPYVPPNSHRTQWSSSSSAASRISSTRNGSAHGWRAWESRSCRSSAISC